MSSPIVLTLDDPRWTSFVESRPEATPFHHPAWTQLLADCYGFRGFAFAVVDGEEIVVGIPVVEVRGPTRRKRWVALPFTDALAPLGPAEHIPSLAAALDSERRAAGAVSLEVHGALPQGAQSVHGWSHVVRLRPDPDEVFRTFKRVRQTIARAVRAGVTIRVGETEDDLLEVFYGLHLLTRRRLGVPIQPRRFFRLLWERILTQGLGTLLIAEVGGRLAAAEVYLHWNGTAIGKFNASDQRMWGAHPNDALIWEAIRRSCEAGLREFDFGRTDKENEGLRAFKARWGTEEHVLVYTAVDGAHAPAGSGWLGSALSAVIRHSPPWVCRTLGERLYRYAA